LLFTLANSDQISIGNTHKNRIWTGSLNVTLVSKSVSVSFNSPGAHELAH